MLNIKAIPSKVRILLDTGTKVPKNKTLKKLEEQEAREEVQHAVNNWMYAEDPFSSLRDNIG